MRVLFTVSSWPTHYMSLLPIGWALQSDGHEVRVVCARSQVGLLGGAGLVAVALLNGIDIVVYNRMSYYREAVDGRWPYPWLPLHPLSGAPLATLTDFDLATYRRTQLPWLAARVASGFDRTVEFAWSWRPDFVIYDPMSLEGLLAARLLGIPAALSLWGPIGTHEPDGLRILAEDLSHTFPRYGLGSFDAAAITQVIDPCPPTIAPPAAAARLPVRYVPYNSGGHAPPWAFNRNDRPRVCVSWSTALTKMSGPRSYVLPQIIAELAGLGVEVVVTATRDDVARLGPLPPSVRALVNSPLRALLPACDALVHHGGAGTTMTAVDAGAPQVILTFASEQARNGERAAAAGVARHLPGHLIAPGMVGDAVRDVLADPAYRQRATQLRADLRGRPTPTALVATLEKLVLG